MTAAICLFGGIRRSISALIIAILVFVSCLATSHAAIDVYDFDSDQQEAQYRGLIEEFRCPKCQNQNLAGSDAPIAQDLKQKTYDMVKDGRSDAEIRQYMQERYGEFISYKPPVRPSTWVLWFFPPLLLILVLIGWFWRNQSRNRKPVGPERFEAQASLSEQEQAALDRLLANKTGAQKGSYESSVTALTPDSKSSGQDQSKGRSL